MTEVPEHLLKRAQAAKEKAAAKRRRRRARPRRRRQPTRGAGDSRIPAHLLERSKAAKARKAGGATGRRRRRRGHGRPRGGRRCGRRRLPAPLATGPGGHTQRLLTVVKSGSIQDVKAKPQDKVHVWPHLLIVEFARGAVHHGLHHDLLDLRERAAARAGRRQQDAEPVEGAVVLPRACRSCSRCSTRWWPA